MKSLLRAVKSKVSCTHIFRILVKEINMIEDRQTPMRDQKFLACAAAHENEQVFSECHFNLKRDI